MQSAANPYQSPRLNDNKPHHAAALDTLSISWRRGIAAAMVAGLVAANTWMAVMTAIVLITETSPREFVRSPEFPAILLTLGLAIYPFFLLAALPALANYTPATRRGMARLMWPSVVLMMLGFFMMGMMGYVLPRAFDYWVGLVLCELLSFLPLILWGLLSTLGQIRRDRQTLG